MPIDATGEDVEHARAYYNGAYGRLRAIAEVPGADQLWTGTSDQGTGKDRILKVTIKRRSEVINGILFRVRTGVPWRDPPERFGRWKTAHERHRCR